MSQHHVRYPQGRHCLIVGLVITAYACEPPESVSAKIMRELTSRCYEAEDITVDEGPRAGVWTRVAAIDAATGHKVWIKGLKKANKDFVPDMRPVIAVAVDPSYAGANQFLVPAPVVQLSGVDVPVQADPTALAALQAQKSAAWTLWAPPAPLGLTLLPQDLRAGIDARVIVPYAAGQPVDVTVPILLAFRAFDSEQFTIVQTVAKPDSTPPVLALMENANFGADGTLATTLGSTLKVADFGIWNDRNTPFNGTVEFHAERGAVHSPLLATAAISIPPFSAQTLSSVTVDTSLLPQGDYSLEATVRDAAGAEVSSAEWPLRVTGSVPTIAFDGIDSTVSVSQGGTAAFWIGADSNQAGALHFLLMSNTLAITETTIAGVTLPMAVDVWTSLGLNLLPLLFVNGAGQLGATGFARVSFVLPPLNAPGLVGLQLSFAPAVFGTASLSSAAPHAIVLVQ